MEAKALQTQQFPVQCGGIFVHLSDFIMMVKAMSQRPESSLK